MTIKPGETQRQVITIGNVHKEKTITLTLGLADWSLDEDGNLILLPPGETDTSAALWARFTPATVTLKPETAQEVVVEITAPFKTGKSGDFRFALLASTLLPEESKRGEASGVWNKYQIATLFYATFQPATSSPSLNTVDLVERDGVRAVAFTFSNDGDAHARLMGTAILRDEDGEIISETPLTTVVLDRSKINYSVKLPETADLEPGSYRIEFDVENHFVPQKKFKRVPMKIAAIEFEAE